MALLKSASWADSKLVTGREGIPMDLKTKNNKQTNKQTNKQINK